MNNSCTLFNAFFQNSIFNKHMPTFTSFPKPYWFRINILKVIYNGNKSNQRQPYMTGSNIFLIFKHGVGLINGGLTAVEKFSNAKWGNWKLRIDWSACNNKYSTKLSSLARCHLNDTNHAVKIAIQVAVVWGTFVQQI